MKKGNYLMSRKLVKNTTFLTMLFVCMALISSSSLSANLNNISETKDSRLVITEVETQIVVETSAGLAPNIANKNINKITKSVPLEDIMYGYIANSSTYDEGPCYFALDDPGTIEFFQDTESDDFLSGGTGTSDEQWLGCEYSNGALWAIDPYTGDMWCIGGGGASLNGLAWDPVYNRLFGASGSKLYEIDPETGEQEFIGSFGGGVNEMIAMAASRDGVMYGWDLGDKLWTIDTETGEATEVGSLGIDLNYAQDGGFDYETGYLWLTAYTISPNYGSYLYYCDEETAECTLIGQIEDNSQITASMLSLGCPGPPHDVGVKQILKPEGSGHAIPEMDMEILVKNYGYTTETFDAQMQVDTYEEGPIILEEDFSGPFPPEGWTTDWWEQSNTNYACGEAPEAMCNKNTQKNQGDYYDNYIMTKSWDCSNIEAVKLSFKLTIDALYPQYCYFYLWYREDSNSPWKGITPWDNPIPWDIDCEPFFITIDGDPYLGEEFQVKWEYIGYYNYFNYIYIDNVTIQEINCLDDYNEVVEDIVLGAGEEVIVDFPTWTPPNWQNPDYENTWQEFPIKACTFLSGDDNPGNDCKEKIIDLYFPWMHDIEITEIGSPSEARSMPAKTFDVEATITNVGQYAECCIPIDISIGEPVVLDTLLTENSWDTVPPEGWYDEHKDYSESYGWNKSNTDYSGGDSPEAILEYTQALSDHVMYSYAINTSEYSSCQLEFKSYINHYSGSGLYALEAGYSTDGETWYAAWHEEPSSSGDYEVSVPIESGHETLYIGFWVKGNPYYFNYWYIDNIFLRVMDFVSEYSDFACQGDDLEPGQSRTFKFDDWTPDFLQYETTGSIDYVVHAEIDMEGDKNPGNDIKSEYFTLDYWHDPALEKVTSPVTGGYGRGDLLWDNGDTDGTNGYEILGSPKRTLLDDFEMDDIWEVSGLRTYMVAGPVSDFEVSFWTDDDGDPGELILGPSVDVDFSIEYTGRTWFGYPEWEVFYEFEPITLDAGRYWIEMWSGSGQPNAFLMIHLGIWGSELWINYDDLGFMPGSQQFGVQADMNFRLYGGACGCPGISTYIQSGTEAISAVAKNYGTFPELDLTCYAEIWDYITDPEGTLHYQDNVTDIDLDAPLGGTVDLAFDDFTFEYEGRYNLFLEMLAPNDDKPNNNKIRWKIGVDATDPVSSHTLDPPEPDGENGWYVSDLEVTLSAYDPRVADVSSGVDEIKYQVNGGPIETIRGSAGSFLLTQEDDGDDVLIEFWAIDHVGNEETQHHTFTIDMDQRDPAIDHTYEVLGGNPVEGWTLLFTAYATDETSGMNRVEFFLNEVWQETVTGPGPEYQWSFIYHGGLNIDVRADAYDIAGNKASDIIENPETNVYNQNTQQQSQSRTSSFFINKPLQRLFVIPGEGYK